MKRSERRAMREMLIVVGLHWISAWESGKYGTGMFTEEYEEVNSFFEIHEQELSPEHLNALAALEHDGFIWVDRWELDHKYVARLTEEGMPEFAKAMKLAKDELADCSYMGLQWWRNGAIHKHIMAYTH